MHRRLRPSRNSIHRMPGVLVLLHLVLSSLASCVVWSPSVPPYFVAHFTSPFLPENGITLVSIMPDRFASHLSIPCHTSPSRNHMLRQPTATHSNRFLYRRTLFLSAVSISVFLDLLWSEGCVLETTTPSLSSQTPHTNIMSSPRNPEIPLCFRLPAPSPVSSLVSRLAVQYVPRASLNVGSLFNITTFSNKLFVCTSA
jgi:hypothetical protein